jgi:hypothetical protein
MIKNFLSPRAMAVAGASNMECKFSYLAYRELKARGFQLYPVNLHEREIDGDKCYNDVNLF